MSHVFDPSRDISIMAIAAINEMMESFSAGTRASILVAQMQSGKTSAFLLLAGEMLRTKMIEHVIIFTGNRERDLKDQLYAQVRGNPDTLERSFFDTKYSRYLETKTDAFDGLLYSEVGELLQGIKDCVTIVWGTELLKKASRIPTNKTLFIFEESHFAQNNGQTPSKFLQQIGLPANGDIRILEAKNSYICSVSATPFSELCDNGNFGQSKKIVRMMPGDGYRGVGWLKETGKIVGYENWETALSQALISKKSECNWAIVRVRGTEQMETAERICREAEWNIMRYDQELSEITNMKDLERKPEQPTLVVLREKSRMGTVVPKNYLSFVFETSTSPRTDTLLQSLLGRACGYHVNELLLVYLNKELLKTGELETYLNFYEGHERSVPSIAKNVIDDGESKNALRSDNSNEEIGRNDGGDTTMMPTIPIKIPRSLISLHPLSRENKESILLDIFNALLTEEVIMNNGNPESVQLQIIKEFEKKLAEVEHAQKFDWHKIHPDNKTFKHIPGKVLEGIERKKAIGLGAGCGGFSIYYVAGNYDDGPRLDIGDYYLSCFVKINDQEHDELKSKLIRRFPNTTGQEIFRGFENMPESRDVAYANGGYTIPLSPETATNVEVMKSALRKLIPLSNDESLQAPRKITSIRQPGFDKFTGIYVSYDVYVALLYGGSIYTTIKEEFNVKLKLTNSRGRPPKTLPPGCISRLAEICW